MKEYKTRIPLISTSTRCGTFAALAFLALIPGVATGQGVPNSASTPTAPLPDAPGVRVISQPIPVYETQTAQPQHVDQFHNVALRPAHSELLTTPAGARLITLQQAQEKAAPANSNPMARLGQLQVEVARQTRLGTMSTFFPQIGSTFTNFHFNKFMGELLQVTGPLGNTRTGALPLAGKDQTFVAVTATQPITPLFHIHELYKINLADERIARAKAGMPVPETASKVEKAYYELLVAQRQLDFAKVKAAENANKWLVASSSAAIPVASSGHDDELVEISNCAGDRYDQGEGIAIFSERIARLAG